MKSIYLILLIGMLSISQNLSAQVPVADYFGRYLSKITSTVQQASQVISEIAEPLVNTFQTVQSFFVKAETVVNGVIKNMKLIQDIVDLHQDIQDYYTETIDILNSPRDTDHDGNNDGEDDLNWLDKWKHLNILLALVKESTAGFELLNNLVQDDALTMDDYNRVELLKDTRQSLLKVKTAIRIERRRINREILHFGRLEHERNTFDAFFSN